MQEMIKDEFADLPEEYKKEIPPLDEVYRIDPNPDCPSGTRGRVGVYEMFDMNIELEKAILANKSEDDLFKIVRKSGMITMKEDAIIKSAQGIVPFEEVNTLGGQFDLGGDTPEVAAPAPQVIAEDGTPGEEGDKETETEIKI
jgi:type II secretory ATPase GspE/PulE/Tfp pilus assembly ATPase PilB-like protein